MPEIRHYVVKRTIKVDVDANSSADAIQLAEAAFRHGQESNHAIKMNMGPSGIWGNTKSKVRVIKTEAEEVS